MCRIIKVMSTTDSTIIPCTKQRTKLTSCRSNKHISTSAQSNNCKGLYGDDRDLTCHLSEEHNLESTIPSCVRSLSLMLGKRRLSVTLEGKFFRVLPSDQYRIYLLRICALIMIGFLAHIIRRFPYHHITIIGNSVYSKVAASTLSSCGVPFALCRGNNRISYYETENGKEVAFEGPSAKEFLETIKSSESSIPVIPLSSSEISKVEQHTGLKNLAKIQAAVLSHFPDKNGVHLANLSDIISGVKPNHNPVMHVKKFFGNLYYIMTTNEIWLTQLIISDTVVPLQPGEIISTSYGSVVREGLMSTPTSLDYNITSEEDRQIITQPSCRTELIRKDSYSVEIDLGIKQLSRPRGVLMSESVDSDLATDDSTNVPLTESIIYSLNRPRPFIYNSINVVHPFHLPMTWDPFLTMMIVTRGLLL